MLRDSDEFRDGLALCYVTVMSSGRKSTVSDVIKP